MKSNKVKNLKIRSSFSKKEFLIKVNKFLRINLLNTWCSKKNKSLILNLALNQKISKATIKNKCVLTGCNNSVNKDYNLSRMMFRKLLQFGIMSNYSKAVW